MSDRVVDILLVMAPPPHVASRRILVRRLARNGTLVFVLVFVAVGIGAAGYHFFDDLPWLDAALNATMILTGMGPVNPVVTPAGKLFAIAYALFSGVFFLTMVAVLLAPALQHFLHRFHLELGEHATRGQAQGGPVRQAQGEPVRQAQGEPVREAQGGPVRQAQGGHSGSSTKS